ncbi:c-type cytochrome [Henriciella aquimarina]|uniref:c-type cytochrome n=1 Tax=Henriciella aquimarina TaxID=545261 RepID=UPI000A076813|nr:cytochrome c family protein [Henriciella aquimarina]
MGDLFWNKVFGAILAVLLGVMGLKLLSETVFGHGGGHHGGEEEEMSLNDWAHSRFAYYTDIAETGGGAAEEEEVYDLGALLANADASRGERSFKAKCTTCHTIEQGGANGTGPNLYGIMTAEHAHKDNFGYSSAMMETAGKPWTYESIDEWLTNPSSYIRGTTMAFAGLRRDEERADVIAYLASMTPNAPAFPEPLPEEEETETAEGEEGGEATDAAAEGEPPEAEPAAEGETTEAAPAEGEAADTAETANEPAEGENAGEAEGEAASEEAAPAEEEAAPAETGDSEPTEEE